MAEINERASVSVECPLSPTSTTASDEVRSVGQEAFAKLKAFVGGQVQQSVDDYKLLEDMNKVTTQRYQDMHQVAQNITQRLGDLTAKYEELKPYLQQIDEIEKCSRDCEATVSVLEKYLTTLETKLKVVQLSSPV